MDLDRSPPAPPDGLHQLRDGHVVRRPDDVHAVQAVHDPGAAGQDEDDGLALPIHVHPDQVRDHGFGHPTQVVGVAEGRGQPARAPAGTDARVFPAVEDANDGLAPREPGGDLGWERIGAAGGPDAPDPRRQFPEPGAGAGIARQGARGEGAL